VEDECFEYAALCQEGNTTLFFFDYGNIEK
jgi:hypothetical protein